MLSNVKCNEVQAARLGSFHSAQFEHSRAAVETLYIMLRGRSSYDNLTPRLRLSFHDTSDSPAMTQALSVQLELGLGAVLADRPLINLLGAPQVRAAPVKVDHSGVGGLEDTQLQRQLLAPRLGL